MTAAIQGVTAWLASNILALLGLIMMGLTVLIGQKVRQLLDERKIPEQLAQITDRLARIEKGLEDHEKRIDKVEAKL